MASIVLLVVLQALPSFCFCCTKKRMNCFSVEGHFFPSTLSATPGTSTLRMHTMSSARNASFLTSKWKVPSFPLFLPRWRALSPFRQRHKAKQDAKNLKNGPLWAAGGEHRHIKERYRLQIMHVPRLISSERNGRTGDVQMRCGDLAWWMPPSQTRDISSSQTRWSEDSD